MSEEQYEAIREERKQHRTRQKSERVAAPFNNASATTVSMTLSALIGLGATVVFLAAVFPFTSEVGNASIPNLFLKRGWVPYVLTFFMFWSLAILVFKWMKIRRQREAMHYDLLPNSVAKTITQETVFDFEYHLKQLDLDTQGNFLVTRILRALSYFSVQRDHGKTAEMLTSQSEIDATTVDSSYSLLRIFIWAVPILGFIGTVIGISTAIANFSGAMNNSNGIEGIKESLPLVTGGLGVAFDTTLLGLVISLLLMFPMSILQKEEEDLLNAVDQYCNDHLLKRLDDGRAPMDTWTGDPHDPRRLDFLQGRMEKLMENQMDMMQNLMSVVDVVDEDEGE